MIITLSDGKPEDYDDHKGQYAIIGYQTCSA